MITQAESNISALGCECFYCGGVLKDPAVMWQGASAEMYLHLRCVVPFTLRLGSDLLSATEEQNSPAAPKAPPALFDVVAPHSDRQPAPPPIRVYLAGKITKGDWRLSVASCDALPGGCLDWHKDRTDFPESRLRVPGIDAICTGPFFISCDHGCMHGPGSHGVGVGVDWCVGGLTGDDVQSRCFAAIRRSDAVFAWLDDPTCFGTLVEVGFALAHHIPVLIAGPPQLDELHREMWFAVRAATLSCFTFRSPVDALGAALRMFQTLPAIPRRF